MYASGGGGGPWLGYCQFQRHGQSVEGVSGAEQGGDHGVGGGDAFLDAGRWLKQPLLLPVMPGLDLGSIVQGRVEVVGFGAAVQQLQSKQLPKVIQIVGDDLEARKYLVKVGWLCALALFHIPDARPSF